jgi:hypothetical protein
MHERGAATDLTPSPYQPNKVSRCPLLNAGSRTLLCRTVSVRGNAQRGSTPRTSISRMACHLRRGLPALRPRVGHGDPERCGARVLGHPPSTWPPSPSCGSATAPAAAATTARSPRARPPRKRCAPSSAASATPSGRPWSPTPDAPRLRQRRRQTRRAPEGNRGTTLSPARPAHTPIHRLLGQATPEPDPRLRPPASGLVARRHRHRREPEEVLDKQRGLVRCGQLAGLAGDRCADLAPSPRREGSTFCRR